MNASDEYILLETVIKEMQETKARDITILDLKKIETAICKYFVICSGNSNTHVSSISNNVKKYIAKSIKEKPWSTEGKETSEWILLDYTDIVIHVFQEETRNYYKIEDLWGDAKMRKIKN